MTTKTQRAITSSRTLFPRKRKRNYSRPINGLRVLKPVTYNTKMSGSRKGKVIVKGPWRGMPLYNLTLEERATCSRTCPLRRDCYGNNMPWAIRHVHGPVLEKAIAFDVERLCKRHPDGFVVRLHVLGDFYSVRYVDFWLGLVEAFESLHVFGFTHRLQGTRIGDRITEGQSARFRILRSDPPVGIQDPLPAAYTLPKGVDEPVAGTVLCPAASGRTESCLTCGLCFNGRTSVSWPRH